MNNFILYTTENGNVNINVNIDIENETIWLNQKQLSQLFGVGTPNINEHLKNIYNEQELDELATIRNFRIVQIEGSREVSRNVAHYNLDAIISVGYRVNSKQATNFRKWATSTLREYLIKGFVVNDERLKQGSNAFGNDYFQELLEKVRSIRTSERRMHQKITDIYAECSTDYDKTSGTTRQFSQQFKINSIMQFIIKLRLN